MEKEGTGLAPSVRLPEINVPTNLSPGKDRVLLSLFPEVPGVGLYPGTNGHGQAGTNKFTRDSGVSLIYVLNVA